LLDKERTTGEKRAAVTATMVKKSQPKKSQPKATRPPKQPSAPSAPPTQTQTLDVGHQQRLLNIFSSAFQPVLSSDALPDLLQGVKQALFNRDFALAFGREDYLEAYAARWSPTRALCYASVLQGVVREHLDDLLAGVDDASGEQKPEERDAGAPAPGDDANEDSLPRKRLRMISVGGCAAEHVAFASLLHSEDILGDLALVDSAPWSNIVNLLQTAITTAPPLSKYASAAAKASNTALVPPSQLSLSFEQLDILDDAVNLESLLGPQPVLVTLFFTLNELYTSGGIAKTTKYLSKLEITLPKRSLLLVVDSPGSYSEAAVGKEKKRYPMQWLLDHTLRDPRNDAPSWERLESQESTWFRLPKELSYPMQLEDMRYQIHLYRLREESDKE
jgi:25S rRNA (uracil2843-N3)-methyltransferase